MACCNSNLCRKEGYCEMGAYCTRVHPNVRKQLLKRNRSSAIDIEIFRAGGSGRNCTKS